MQLVLSVSLQTCYRKKKKRKKETPGAVGIVCVWFQTYCRLSTSEKGWSLWHNPNHSSGWRKDFVNRCLEFEPIAVKGSTAGIGQSETRLLPGVTPF